MTELKQGWFLPIDSVNSIQEMSINSTILRAKHAHHTDIDMRINGKNEHFEADWIKHMIQVQEDKTTNNFESKMTDTKTYALVAEIERLKNELAEAERDAKRYRYLRSKAVYEGSSDWTIEVWGRFASIEEAIDEAMLRTCAQEDK